jgi:hypothetical protein
VRDETGREWTDGHAGKEVAHDGRQAQTPADKPEDERGGQPAGQREDQVQIMGHR